MCKINTRTTIIAATNPVLKGQKWDPQFDINVNTGLATSLLSRFDLIFIMIDSNDELEDRKRADHVLKRNCEERRKSSQSQQWSTTKLCKYITFVQKVFEPVVSEEAEIILNTYY